MKPVRALVAALIAALVTSLLGVVPANASQPVTFTIEFDDTFTDTEACDFPIEVSFVGSLRITEFSDRSGELVRVQVKGTDYGTATNRQSGKTASGRDNWLETFDARTGTSTIRGLYIRLNVPGHGVVLLDVGYAEFDGDGVLVQLSGPHQAFEGEFEALCAALA
ncbi:MAG TPA: hypothetical protein VK908_12145 [Jiangellales bacterium]|nr:hypothetical protein [Jiangellales bacterium]